MTGPELSPNSAPNFRTMCELVQSTQPCPTSQPPMPSRRLPLLECSCALCKTSSRQRLPVPHETVTTCCSTSNSNPAPPSIIPHTPIPLIILKVRGLHQVRHPRSYSIGHCSRLDRPPRALHRAGRDVDALHSGDQSLGQSSRRFFEAIHCRAIG
jgi:hypothetical protein